MRGTGRSGGNAPNQARPPESLAFAPSIQPGNVSLTKRLYYSGQTSVRESTRNYPKVD